MADEGASGPSEHLQGVAAVLAAATGRGAAVRQRVVDEQADLAGWGFRGIARNLQRVVVALDEVIARSDLVATDVVALRAECDRVIAEAAPEQVVGVFAPAASEIRRCVAQISAVDSGLVGVQDLLTEVLHGGRPEVLVGRIQAIRDDLTTADHLMGAAAAAAANSALATARRAGTAEPGDDNSGAAAPSALSTFPEEVAQPDRRRQLAAAQLPARRPDNRPKTAGERNDPTHGIVTNDDAGDAQVGSVQRSGVRGPNMGRPGLRSDMRWGSPNHVENHAAAMMRADRSLRNVTLVINNPEVCNARQRNPDGSFKQYTCDEQLADQLPRGARLNVYVPDPDTGQRLWTTYVGTGRGLIVP